MTQVPGRGVVAVILGILGACGPLGPVARDEPRPTPKPGATSGPKEPSPNDGTPPDPDSTDAGSAPEAGPSKPPNSAGGYSVEGPTIFDARGLPHLFHGIARPSLEWTPEGEQLSSSDYERMAGWKANVVRIALNQGFWLVGSKVYRKGYPETIDQNIAWAEQAGMDVILDLHWSDRGDFNTTPAQQVMADKNSLTFWKQVAARYKDDPRILFELYNEPHDIGWDLWRSGGRTSDGVTVVGMQTLYDAVRGTGAQNLVIIGGLGYAFDLSGVALNPIRGFNVVYATHPYNQPNKQYRNWEDSFGALVKVAPVIATEFGDFKECTPDYTKSFIEYAETKGISWTAWAWFVGGCSFPSLITDWNGTPSPSGAVVKTALGRL